MHDDLRSPIVQLHRRVPRRPGGVREPELDAARGHGGAKSKRSNETVTGCCDVAVWLIELLPHALAVP